MDFFFTDKWYHQVHQILKLNCFLYCLAVVFAQSIETKSRMKIGAVPTGAPTTFEWSPILFPTKVRRI